MRQLGISFCSVFQPVNIVNQLNNLVMLVILPYCHAGGESNKYLEGEGHYPSHVVSDYKRLLSGLVSGLYWRLFLAYSCLLWRLSLCLLCLCLLMEGDAIGVCKTP